MISQRGNAEGRLIGLRSHLSAQVVPGDATYLISERGVTAIQGADLEAVVPLLDGTRDLRALVSEAAPSLTPSQVAHTIGQLARAGLLRHRNGGQTTDTDRSSEAYWELAGTAGAQPRCAPALPAEVRIITVGGIDTPAVHAACTAAGLDVVGSGAHTDAGPDRPLSLVVCDDYLNPALEEVDALHRSSGTAWLLARPQGTRAWTGPVFEPGDGPCWSCLAHRLRAHRQTELHVQTALGLANPVNRTHASIPASLGLGLQLAVLECTKWLAGHRHGGQRAVVTLDSLTLASRTHVVRRRPQCPSCGDPRITAARMARPVRLASRLKSSRTGNGHRALAPEEVLERYGHLVSPITGVVKEIRRDPRGPAALNCFRAGHNVALGTRGAAEVRENLRTESGGKGVTPLDAEVSALCEALERHSGLYHGDEPVVRDSFDALADDAVHPDACQLYAERQFRDRHRWNASHPAFQFVCDPLDTAAPLDWTPVWSLTYGRQRLLPTGMLYYSHPQEPGRTYVRADSNGSAAGTCLEDAIVQGFLELVERDAVALWWYNRTRHPAVGLDAFHESWIDGMRRVYAGLGREVWALDLTSDLGIPVVVALSRRTGGPTEDIVMGFGAHFDPQVALTRALTEMNQMLPSVTGVGTDGDGYGSSAPELLSWWRGATVAGHPYLAPDPGVRARTRGDFAYVPRDDLRKDVAAVDALVRSRGMELLVLDQTRPDIELPVVKVIVPGLRHFWARFAPGRLFDVPVDLGHKSAATAYEDLNPIPLFM